MQWYSPFRQINSGTQFGHTPAALRCRRRHLAALPASGPGASASAGGAPALLGASASAGGAPALRGASAAGGSPRSSRAQRKEDGAIRRMVCTCPFRRMVCYTCLLFAVTHVLFGGWSARVLFGGWSVTHVSYLPLHMSFSADGLHVSFSANGLLHMSPICRYTCPFRRMVCTCPFRRMVCYTLHSWGCLTPPKRARIALGEQGRRPFPWLVCTTATCACVAALGPSITSLPNSAAPICPFRRMVREAHNLSFWRLHILADGLHMLCFWRMVCTGHYTNGADPAPCTLHCLRPDSIPYTLGCTCGTSTLKLFGLICGPCHQKGERLHTGTGQEHNSYPCLPLP